MKMDAFILVVIGISAVVESRDCLNNKSSNVDSIKDEISETGEALNESQLINIQSYISQLNGDYQANKASVKNNDENSGKAKVINLGFDADNLRQRKVATSDTKKELLDEGFFGALDTSGQDYELNRKDEISVANNNIARRNEILDYILTILHKNRGGNEDDEASKANRRLDIEDNGDDFADLVDIDDPRLNYYNQDADDDTEDIKATRRLMGYGARLDMKGRSGTFFGEGKKDKSPVDPGLPINMKTNRFLYHPAISTRRGLFFNPGFFHYVAAPPPASSITFTKINSQDLLHPINNISIRGDSRRLELLQDQLNEGNTEVATLDPNSNAYAYEPENETLKKLAGASKDVRMKGIQNNVRYSPAHRYLKRDLWSMFENTPTAQQHRNFS